MEMDIYSHKKQLEVAIKSIGNLDISNKNKELMMEFDKNCIIRGLTKSRRLKYLNTLKVIAKIIKKDFDKADKQDIINFVSYIQSREDYKPWTKQGYKLIIKRFYKWLKGNDTEYPEEVKWMKCNIKRNELELPGEGDLLTEEDIKELISAASHPRDKALISMLYESGCRIGELGTLQLSNISFDEYGVVIIVKGKTGSRKIRLIASTSYLINWINIHPFKNNKDSPLWVGVGTKGYRKQMSYSGMRTQIKEIAKRAGINKRCNPHLFRHSKATFMANHLTEFQMNQYFGWIQGSDMPSTYVHLSGKEVDSAILELNGIKLDRKEFKESSLKPKNCVRCNAINNYDSKYCSICSAPLDIKTAIEIEEKRKIPNELMEKLIQDPEVQKVLIEKLNNLDIKI